MSRDIAKMSQYGPLDKLASNSVIGPSGRESIASGKNTLKTFKSPKREIQFTSFQSGEHSLLSNLLRSQNWIRERELAGERSFRKPSMAREIVRTSARSQLPRYRTAIFSLLVAPQPTRSNCCGLRRP